MTSFNADDVTAVSLPLPNSFSVTIYSTSITSFLLPFLQILHTNKPFFGVLTLQIIFKYLNR